MRYPEDRMTRNRTLTDEIYAMIHRVTSQKPAPVTKVRTQKLAFTDTYDGTHENDIKLDTTTDIGTIKVDSNEGTSTTYGMVTGAVDSANTTFIVSNGAYSSGTLRVYLNTGEVKLGVDFAETNPANGIFDFTTAPVTGDVIIASYKADKAKINLLIGQSGAGGVYAVVGGTINGVNKTFTTPAPYVSGSLVVKLNGMAQTQGSSEDWQETTPALGTFTFTTAPVSGDVITVEFSTSNGGLVKESTEDTLDGRVDGTNAVFTTTFPYTSGRLVVSRNLQTLTAGSGLGFTETSSTTFTLSSVATSGEVIEAIYVCEGT